MKRKIVLFILIVVIHLFMVFSTFVSAKQEDHLLRLDHIADEVLQLTKIKRYEESLTLLNNFEAELNTIITKSGLITMDELRMVQISHQEAKKVLMREEIYHEEVLNHVLKFRLVVDAISSTYQPLWAEMENQVMDSFLSVKQSLTAGEDKSFHEQVMSFTKIYDMIYPSLVLDLPIEQVKQVDARVQYFREHFNHSIKKEEAIEQLNFLQKDLQAIFQEVKEDEADPSLWWVIISTGGIIIFTLAFAGYRKYKGEKKKFEKRQKD